MDNFILLIHELIIMAAGFIIVWLKMDAKIKVQDEYKLELKKRETFKDLLDFHTFLKRERYDSDFINKHADSVINSLLWLSDNVLYKYLEYTEKFLKDAEYKILDREIDFANSILLFRKELGYKNSDSKIKPENVALLFRLGINAPI